VDARYVAGRGGRCAGRLREDAIIVVESTVLPRNHRPGRAPAHRGFRPFGAPRARAGKDHPRQHGLRAVHNARTVGADDARTAETVKRMYAAFCEGEIVLTDIRTAEMSKVVENTFRDVNIAFANELARLCRAGGLDVYEIIRIANLHPRVHILTPGPGVGGHCISVDPWFLVGDYPAEARLIRAAREVNDGMPANVLDRALAVMEERSCPAFTASGSMA
jgi:UDP-N-acetyl-D-mannosaminuronic acid dehydrogenase